MTNLDFEFSCPSCSKKIKGNIDLKNVICKHFGQKIKLDSSDLKNKMNSLEHEFKKLSKTITIKM